MRVSLKVEADAPSSTHDLARKVEDAFERVQEASNEGPYTEKGDIIRRMTDAQLAVFETELEQASVRMRQLWYAVPVVRHRAPEFAEFYGEFFEAFGKEEADRILRASGRT